MKTKTVNIKNIAVFFVIMAIFSTVMYVALAFICLELNPIKWHIVFRIIFVVLWLVLASAASSEMAKD